MIPQASPRRRGHPSPRGRDDIVDPMQSARQNHNGMSNEEAEYERELEMDRNRAVTRSLRIDLILRHVALLFVSYTGFLRMLAGSEIL